jgi:hypothetical protein
MVVHIYNPSTQKAEAGGFNIQGQAGLMYIILATREEEIRRIEV